MFPHEEHLEIPKGYAKVTKTNRQRKKDRERRKPSKNNQGFGGSRWKRGSGS